MAQLLLNSEIIGNKRKITAILTNAKAFLQMQEGFGSFDLYIWQFDRSYESLLSKFRNQFSDRDPESISPEEVLSFLVGLNDGWKQLTNHTRYSYLKAFFNFIRNNQDSQLPNPYDAPMLKKLFDR